MVQTILFGNRKGGVGKTTCAILAANAFANAPYNYKVLVVDMDDQQSIGKLYDTAEEEKVKWELLSMPEDNSQTWESFEQVLPDIQKKYDLIIVDVPGRLSTTNSKEYKASLVADMVVMPVAPTTLDWNTAGDYLSVLLDVKKQNTDLRIITFINRYQIKRKKSRQMKNMMGDLSQMGIEPMYNHVSYYEDISDISVDRNLATEKNTHFGMNVNNWVRELHELMKAEN